jgi:hypothetical protein
MRNRSNAWFSGGPDFESRTLLHHCTISDMICLSTSENTLQFFRQMLELSFRGMQLEELRHEGHMPKSLPLSSRDTV